MQSLLSAPPSLTPLQRKLLWITSIVVVATRVYALSDTMWDWDEAQFASAVRSYDVSLHQPHPPGFPVYIALAKLARLFAGSDFAALQTIVFLGACALFPAGFFLARELRFPFWTSFLASLLFAFLPNLWFFGGTAFSDVPGAVLTMAAAAMLLRGCRDARSYYLGALLLALAAGMRPQAMLLGAAPFGVVSWVQFRNSWRRVIAACAILAGTVVVCFTGAIVATGDLDRYLFSVRGHSQWLRTHDAISAATRPAIGTLFDEYFVRPMGAGRLGIVVSVLAALGALRGLRREGARVGLAMLTFLPFALFAYLSLDYHSIHRFSIAYLFLWTLLAAHAVAPVWKWPVAGQIALVLLMTARYAQWGGVMLREVHTDAPPHAAATWLRDHVAKGQRVWFDHSLQPFAGYFLHDRNVQFAKSPADVLRRGRADEYYATEGTVRGGQTFIRPTGRLWDVARRRYFAASVVPVAKVWHFGAGWYDEENHLDLTWRWMSKEGEILVPATEGRARLRLTLAAQERVRPEVEIVVNEVTVDRFALTSQPLTKEWVVNARADAPNRLVIRSSETMNPKALGLSDDTRDLSMMLYGNSWEPLH